MYVSIFFVRTLAMGLRARGIRETLFLDRAGITREEFADPTLRLPYDRYECTVRAAREIIGDDATAGVTMGMAWPLNGSILTQLWSNAATLRESLEMAARYRRLAHEAMRMRLVERDDVATVIFENPECDEDNARFEAESTMVYLMRVGRFLTGREGPPASVTFIGPEPADLREHVAAFGIAPLFGADRDSLTFPRKLLDLPNIHHDPGVGSLLVQRADELVAGLDDDARLVSRLRDLLRLAGDPTRLTIDDLATRVGTSVRVLQRKLQSRGTSVSELVDDVRKTVAIDAISNGALPIKEVADRLGFSEPSAFHRAFKRWTGETPAVIREKRRSSRPPPA